MDNWRVFRTVMERAGHKKCNGSKVSSNSRKETRKKAFISQYYLLCVLSWKLYEQRLCSDYRGEEKEGNLKEAQALFQVSEKMTCCKEL